MYLYIIFILAQTPCVSAPSSPPPEVKLKSGQGWWLTSQCEWEPRACPKASTTPGGDALVHRLPMGCSAVRPTIAYSPAADLKVRKDFAEANTRVEGLQLELKLSRDNLTRLSRDSLQLVEKSAVAIDTCLDAAKLQGRALDQVESQLFWSRLTVATSIVAVIFLSTYSFVVVN